MILTDQHSMIQETRRYTSAPRDEVSRLSRRVGLDVVSSSLLVRAGHWTEAHVPVLQAADSHACITDIQETHELVHTMLQC